MLSAVSPFVRHAAIGLRQGLSGMSQGKPGLSQLRVSFSSESQGGHPSDASVSRKSVNKTIEGIFSKPDVIEEVLQKTKTLAKGDVGKALEYLREMAIVPGLKDNPKIMEELRRLSDPALKSTDTRKMFDFYQTSLQIKFV